MFTVSERISSMKTKILPALLLGAVLLAGCAGQKPAASTMDLNGPPMEGCSVKQVVPDPNPTIQALLPPVSDNDHILGKRGAKITIIEYSDYLCPYCGMLAPVLTQLSKNHPDDLLIILRYFPLDSHPNSLPASYAAEAAGLQGKWHEFSDELYANQATWGNKQGEDLNNYFVSVAEKIGIDSEKLLSDMQNSDVKAVVDSSKAFAQRVGIPGTPFLFINDQPYQSALDIDSLESFLKFMSMNETAYTSCPPMVIDENKSYIAKFKTEAGNFDVKLDPKAAPKTVNSFVFLARNGWYNDTTFHRVISGFVAQGGDPSGSGLGGPGYEFINENSDAKFDREGLIAMANSGKDTNGSQFFITYDALPNLNGGYTIFGEVINGMDKVKKITLRDPATNQALPKGTRILSVEIQER